MVASAPGARHRMSLENVRPEMAKADLTNRENTCFRAQIGQAVQRAFSLAGWSIKEAAAQIGKEPAQVSRWIAGTERAQFDALFAVEELRQPFIVALAALVEDVEVVTEIRFRKVG